MSDRWYVRGTTIGLAMYRCTYRVPLVGPPLFWMGAWLLNHTWLAYYHRRDDGTWERIA